LAEYNGRLAADGQGNLLADEGDRQGEPVAYDEESDAFHFLSPGETSHNARHHQQFATVDGTSDETAGTPDDPTPGQEHHFGILPEDPHFNDEADGRTQLRFDPDKHASKVSGHTATRGTDDGKGRVKA
jgi:hypothetical protein